MSASADMARATRREWIGLAVIALPCVLYSMDLTVLFLAVPHLTADLEPGSAQLLWIIDIYGFLVAGFLITMGTLGDRIGRRKLLMTGAAAFGAASVLAAFSSSAEMLILSRAILGVAAATLAPSTLSLIRNMFHDPGQRTVAISVWATSYSVGAAIGPLVGGILLQHFWWGSVFLANVPVMVLLLIVGPALLPEYRDPQAGRLDLASAALSLAAVLAVIYGLKRIAEHGAGWIPAVSIVAGLVLGYVFLRRQRVLADPLIDLGLFRTRAFSAALATNTFSLFVAFAMFLYVAQYLQLVVGLSPLHAGLWTLPSSLAFVAGSLTAPALVRNVSPVTVISGSLALAAIGLIVLAQADGGHGLAVVVIASVVLAAGICPPIILSTDLIVGAAPPQRAGAASAISETGAEVGGALGIAVLGSIATAVYRSMLDGALPAALPTALWQASRATLGGALEAAAWLPARAGIELVETARGAFVDSLVVIAWIGAVMMVVLAVITAILLRRQQPSAGAGHEAEPAVEEPDDFVGETAAETTCAVPERT